VRNGTATIRERGRRCQGGCRYGEGAGCHGPGGDL